MTEVSDHPNLARCRWMAILARADVDTLDALLAECDSIPTHSVIRGPEGGLVMVRGRAGGGGAPFNLGEMTVTRCAVRTAAGFVGHAYIAGRKHRLAERAALVDALMQDPDWAEVLHAHVLAPLADAQAAVRQQRATKAAATRVDFFAMQTTRA